MTDIFENAVHSIQIGIEDFQSNDERRPVSALRNFYAGVLLLGKQCLLNAAPDADPMDVLASKFAPVLNDDGDLVHQPKGFQTIDLAELRERFKAFRLTWPAGEIKDLQKLRNEFEHYHSETPKDAIRQAIASCFPLVEGFFAILDRAPKTELGDAWDVMLAEKKFFEKLKSECDGSFNAIAWWHEITERSEIRCPTCGSSLLYQEDDNNSDPAEIKGRCKACGDSFSAEQTVELLIETQFGADDYIAAKEGSDPVIHDCPECSNSTYVETGDTVKCFWCDYAISGSCARCGTSLGVSNMSVNNSQLCDYCDHVMSKDD
ncbi:DNA-directed RNA polymerase subunit RPC12/RpoP [Bradyrhizobium japonicum]